MPFTDTELAPHGPVAPLDWARACDRCAVRLIDRPDDPGALIGMALFAEAQGNRTRAEALLDRALAALPDDRSGQPVAQTHALRLMVDPHDIPHGADVGDRIDVDVEAEMVAEVEAALLAMLGQLLSGMERHDAAVVAFAQATDRHPDGTPLWRSLADALRRCGRFDEAEAAYDRALAIDPGDADAWWARAALHRRPIEHDPAPVLEALWHARGNDPDRALRIGHALARLAEDRGDYDTAMRWLAKAKAAKAAVVRHDPDAIDDLCAAAVESFAIASGRAGLAGPRPVFVVGARRAGTPIAGRILAGHPAMVSVGESAALPVAIKRLAATRSAPMFDIATLAAAGRVDPVAIGQAYLDALAAAGRDDRRTVDRMPLNLIHAGLVHAALPDARIIRLRRHPLDTLLANWRHFRAPCMVHDDYNWRLTDLARWVISVERLAAYWFAVLPADRYLEIGYEDLVTHQSATARRLLQFCGLDWDERCLASPVHDAVSPPSPPPAKYAVGAWRRVVEHLEPAIDILLAAGIIDPLGNPAGVAAR